MQAKDFASGITHITHVPTGTTERASLGNHGDSVYVTSRDGVPEAMHASTWRTLDEVLVEYRPATAIERDTFEARFTPAPVNYL